MTDLSFAQLLGLASLSLTFLSLLITVAVLISKNSAQAGRHEEFKDITNRRLDALEKSDSHAITREELDARFNEMRASIEALRHRMDDIVVIFREALKR